MTTLQIVLQIINVVVGIGLILSMVLHVTESEAGGGSGLGFGSVGGRRISTSRGSMATFFERFLGIIAIGFILTAFLHAWIAGRTPMS